MNILYYDWNSNSNEDICRGFSDMGFYYDIWQHSLNNYDLSEF